MKLIKALCLLICVLIAVFSVSGCVNGSAENGTEPETQAATEPETQEVTEPETLADTSDENCPFKDLSMDEVEKVEIYYWAPIEPDRTYIYECTDEEARRYVEILNGVTVTEKHVPEAEGCIEFLDPSPGPSIVYLKDGGMYCVGTTIYDVEDFPYGSPNFLYIDDGTYEPNQEFIDELIEFDLEIRAVIAAQGIEIY